MDASRPYYLRRERFTQKLLTDAQMPASARAIGALLASLCTPKRPYTYPSREQIAKASGCGTATVDRAIAKLKALGYFEVQSGGTDFLTGEGVASHYRPVLSIANSFSMKEALGVTLTSDEGVVITGDRGVVITSDELMSEDEAGRSAAPSSSLSVGRSPCSPANSAGNFRDDFSRLYTLANENGKAGDAPIEKVYEAYEEARGYPGVTAESLFNGYAEELNFWRGKRRNKADYLARFLQNSLKVTGALMDKPPADTVTSRDRAEESGRPVGGTAETKPRPADPMPYEYYAVVQAVGRGAKFAVKAESERRGTDFYECYRLLCAMAMKMRTTLKGVEFSRVVEAMHHPDYKAMRDETETWSWERMASLLETEEWQSRLAELDDEHEDIAEMA